MTEPAIAIEGHEDLLAHAKAPYLIHTPLRHYMKDTGQALRQAMFRVSPIGRTKRFQRGWVTVMDTNDPPMWVTVRNDDPKAPMVINGTRPHLIRPLGKRALFWPGAAHPYAVVHHPGTKPNDVVAKGLAEAASEIAGLKAAFDADVEERWNRKGGA